jgi:3-methyladenine DNA glycosylase/8-oxoguanine DNA glycosylase
MVTEPSDGALGFDPAVAVEHLRKRDRVLGRFIDGAEPFALTLDPTQSIFLALAEAIVFQQLNGRVAATIFGRVRALFPADADGMSATALLAASDEQLRGAGLSRNKALALRDLALRESTGLIPSLADVRGMDDEAIVEALIAVRGIGRWTAQMLLIFRLGRPDVLPVDDYGVRKGFAAVFRTTTLPTPKEVAARGVRWAPYRTVASWYLWHAVDIRYGAAAAAEK